MRTFDKDIWALESASLFSDSYLLSVRFKLGLSRNTPSGKEQTEQHLTDSVNCLRMDLAAAAKNFEAQSNAHENTRDCFRWKHGKSPRILALDNGSQELRSLAQCYPPQQLKYVLQLFSK